jgi:hypothetical protein
LGIGPSDCVDVAIAALAKDVNDCETVESVAGRKERTRFVIHWNERERLILVFLRVTGDLE